MSARPACQNSAPEHLRGFGFHTFSFRPKGSEEQAWAVWLGGRRRMLMFLETWVLETVVKWVTTELL